MAVEAARKTVVGSGVVMVDVVGVVGAVGEEGEVGLLMTTAG